MLKEVLVVEGKMDTVAIKKALDADTIETGGFTLSPYTLKKIEAAYKSGASSSSPTLMGQGSESAVI